MQKETYKNPGRNLYRDENFDGKVPKYWESLLTEKISRINKLQAAGGEDCFSFALITDVHWSHNAQKSAVLLEKVMTDCNIPFVLNAGDTVCSAPYCDKAFVFEEFLEYRQAFSRIEEKCLLTVGNHDGVYSTFAEPNDYKENLTKEERYQCFFEWMRAYKNRVFGEDGFYYYVDDETNKIRYIVLNTHDMYSDEKDENGYAKHNVFGRCEIGQAQLNWFAHVALNVPNDGWSVVLCSHENAACDERYYTKNHALILGVLKAFKKREKFEGSTIGIGNDDYAASVSADYTGRGGDVIAWVAGHMHEDRIKVQEGIVSVCTDSDSCGWASMVKPQYELGTTKEHIFDVFTINKKTRKVHIIRISGIGEDREVTY